MYSMKTPCWEETINTSNISEICWDYLLHSSCFFLNKWCSITEIKKNLMKTFNFPQYHFQTLMDHHSDIFMYECCQPWTKDCFSFKTLHQICDVISSCTWSSGWGWVQKLKKQTAYAFAIYMKSKDKTAQLLLIGYSFNHIMPFIVTN